MNGPPTRRGGPLTTDRPSVETTTTDTASVSRKYTPVTNAAALRFKALDAYLDAVAAAGPPDDDDRPEPPFLQGTAATFHNVTDEQYETALLADPPYSGVAA
jgi:hypothetical protein